MQLKHELAAGDVDLAAAKIHRVQARTHGSQNLLRIVLAVEHHRVGHARHRRMGKRLTSAVACRLDLHQPGVEPVLHEADENAVLDQHRPIAGRSLVVDRQRAAPVIYRAVVNDGNLARRDAFAHQFGEDTGFLAVEVTLQAVPDRLMEQDAWPSRRQAQRPFLRPARQLR